MSDTKWTLGPWGVHADDEVWSDKVGMVVVPDSGVWERIYYSLIPHRKERQANARLIAAAPDLYEALEAAMAYIDASVGDPDVTAEMRIAWASLNACRPHEVLSKARGEQ